MFTMKSANRFVFGTAGLIAVQVCLGSAAAQVAASDKAVVNSAAAAEPEGAVNMTVAIDADTGKLRPATAEEAAALRASALRRGLSTARSAVDAPMGTFQRQHASGGRGARLTDEFVHLSMVVQRADGTLTTACVHASAQEAAFAHSLQISPKAKTELTTE